LSLDHRIFTESKTSAVESFDEAVDAISANISKIQKPILILLESSPITPEILARVKGDNHMSSQQYVLAKKVPDLMRYVEDKRTRERDDYSKFKLSIPENERVVLDMIFEQGFNLLKSFKLAIEKFKTDDKVLGVIYWYLDDFTQIPSLYFPVRVLEYLERDKVMVSTKFRKYLEN